MKKLLLTLGAIASVAAPVAAVVACGTTPAKTPTRIDEGFANDSLIENFDIKNETPTKSYKYKDVDYKTLEPALKAFIADFSPVLTKDLEAVGMTGITITGKIDAGKLKFNLIQGGKSILTPGKEETTYDTFDDFVAQAFQQANPKALAGVQSIDDDVRKMAIKTFETQEHSFDSILYSQANALNNLIKTEKDEVYVLPASGLKDFYMRPSKEFDITKLKSFTYNDPISAEMSGGDSIIFAFDNPADIASFTKRVRYIDGSTSSSFELTNIKDADSLSSPDYKIVSGKITSQGTNKFTLEAYAKNAIKLTFADTAQNINGQSIALLAFKDENADKKIDHNDVSIINPFYITKGYTADYISSAISSVITKEKFVFGHAGAKKALEAL